MNLIQSIAEHKQVAIVLQTQTWRGNTFSWWVIPLPWRDNVSARSYWGVWSRHANLSLKKGTRTKEILGNFWGTKYFIANSKVFLGSDLRSCFFSISTEINSSALTIRSSRRLGWTSARH